MNKLLEEYYYYLLDNIGANLPEHQNYTYLLEDLNDKEFIWRHPMDENRDIDGLYLRKEFLFDTNRDISLVWDDPRSVLEVLIAFSKRIETEITGEPGNDDIGRWFWVMLDNLGILLPDDHYDHGLVMYNLDIWLLRKFKSDGREGIFPLKKPNSDQRDVDMWYQMQSYLNENWSF